MKSWLANLPKKRQILPSKICSEYLLFPQYFCAYFKKKLAFGVSIHLARKYKLWTALTADGNHHFMWSSEPHEGLATCRAKEVPSFLSYFKTWVLVQPWESNLCPPALQSSTLPTELILPQQNSARIDQNLQNEVPVKRSIL